MSKTTIANRTRRKLLGCFTGGGAHLQSQLYFLSRKQVYFLSLSLSASEAAPMIWRPSNTMSLADSRRSAGDGGGAGRVANGAAEIADGFLARETAAATLDLDVCGRAPILCKRLL
jgi:hypothetical protein